MPNKSVVFENKTITAFWSEEELNNIHRSTFNQYKRLAAQTWFEPEEGEYLCEECGHKYEDYDYKDPNFGHNKYCSFLQSIIIEKLDEDDLVY